MLFLLSASEAMRRSSCDIPGLKCKNEIDLFELNTFSVA